MQAVADALKNLSDNTNNPLFDVLGDAFDAAGEELSLVGGPVRDAILGRVALDLDFTTSADPDKILKIVKPLASATWDVGREFGTIAAQIGDHKIEITSYRADSYDKDSRKPTVEFGDNLEDDLKRRDFTVNAMALRLPSKTFVDPHQGLRDLMLETLRTPAAPEISFSDDPLRMMRAARFTSQLGFELDPAAFAAMRDMASRIEIISAERVRDELSKLLISKNPQPGLELLVESGIAELVLPELPALRLEVDEHHHHKDVYQHSLTVVAQAISLEPQYGFDRDLTLRLAALLHDIGKPATRKLEQGGSVTFHHHDVVGAKLAKKRLTALRFQLKRLHILTRADVTTRNQRKADRLAHAYDDLEARIKVLAEQEQLDAMRPDLDGEEIMQLLGIKPGREVGEAYNFLLELRLDEGAVGKDEAKKRLLEWWPNR